MVNAVLKRLSDGARPGLLRRLVESMPPPKLFRLFRRIAERDSRNWGHFAPF